MKRLKQLLIASLFFVFTMIFSAVNANAAASATMGFTGKSTVNTGETFTEDIKVTGISGGKLITAGGKFVVADSTCVQFVSNESENDSTLANGAMFAWASMNGTNKDLNVTTITLKAGSSSCTTTIEVQGGELAFNEGTKSSVNPKLTITVGTATPKSSDATLKSLTPNKGTLSPAFAPGTTGYNLEVESTDTSVSFTAVPNDPKATIKSGSTCNLTGATTSCKVVVKAEDGTEKTYTVTVKKKTSDPTPGPDDPDPTPGPDDPDPTPGPDDPDPTPGPTQSSDATLKVLNIPGFSISPSFNKDKTSYTLTVNNDITSLDVTALPTDPNATVTISGNNNLKVGVNPITITVRAEDGTTKTYIVNVTRKSLGGGTVNTDDPKKDSDNDLTDIEISDGTLSPSFKKDVTEYSITVPYETTSLDLTPILSSNKAKYTITGNSNFQVGKVNVVTIKVTAEDGSVKVYNINVTRSNKKGNALLDDIKIGGGTLQPGFDPDNTRYDVEVKPGTDSIDIDAIPHDPSSKVEIIGGDNLKEGLNKVRVIVTDENGFQKVYYLNVYKPAAKKFLGLTLGGWLALLGGLLLLGLLLFIIFALLKKKKPEKEEEEDKDKTPVIEFKPEFNFGSKNGTDDDIVEKGGVLNQYTGNTLPPQEGFKAIPEAHASVKDREEVYDPYDDVVTKDELFDAIEEAKETKDVDKLKMLYEQELLNRKKAELKAREQNRR